jgi:hypothetical protein
MPKKAAKKGIKKGRDYKKEYREYHGTKVQKERRNARGRARYKMEKAGKVHKGDGKDVDHKNRNPHNNSDSNLRVTSQKKNRGWRKGKS